jgi:hypothetical protein
VAHVNLIAKAMEPVSTADVGKNANANDPGRRHEDELTIGAVDSSIILLEKCKSVIILQRNSANRLKFWMVQSCQSRKRSWPFAWAKMPGIITATNECNE